MIKPTLTLGKPRVKIRAALMPQTITMILPLVKVNHGYKNLSSSISLLWLESDLTKVKHVVSFGL